MSSGSRSQAIPNHLRKLGTVNEKNMKRAVMNVVKRGLSIRGTAASSGIAYATLRKYVLKYKNSQKDNNKTVRYTPNYEVNLIYSKEQEDILENYLLKARRLHYALTCDHIRRLAYNLAKKHNLKVPNNWDKEKYAGKQWLYGYLRRHPIINDIVSWSRKFRPPVKNQFNTSLELANINTEKKAKSAENYNLIVQNEVEVFEPSVIEGEVKLQHS